MISEIPPCIIKILNSKELLEKYYLYVLQYYRNYKKDSFDNMMDLILRVLGNVTIDSKLLDTFDCTELRELCEEECPLFNEKSKILDRLKEDTSDVFITKRDDGTYLIVLLKSGKIFEIKLESDRLGKELAANISFIYRIFIDLDLRRKDDRKLVASLLNYWIRRAKDVNYELIEKKLTESKGENYLEDKMYIRDLALNYIYTAPIRPLDNWLENPACAVVLDRAEEAEYAYILKEAVLSYVSGKIGKRLSFKYLTQLLKPEVEPVRIRIKGFRYNFYKFKMTEEQKQSLLAFIKEVKEAEEKEKKEQEEKSELSEEYDEWDLSDLLNKE